MLPNSFFSLICAFVPNATYGGGIFVEGNGTLNLEWNLYITKNYASIGGGAIAFGPGANNFRVNGGFLTDNTADDGAGISFMPGSNATVNGTIVYRNNGGRSFFICPP